MHQRTIFETPIVNTLLRGISVGFLKLTGWKVEGQLPPGSRQVRADRRTAHQQLGPALHADGVLRAAAQRLLDGQGADLQAALRPRHEWLGGIPVHREQVQQPGGLVGRGDQGGRRPAGADRAARGHAQQDALLEDRLLLDRGRRRGADRDGLHGLRAEAQRPRARCSSRPATSRPTWRRSRPSTRRSAARTPISSRLE